MELEQSPPTPGSPASDGLSSPAASSKPVRPRRRALGIALQAFVMLVLLYLLTAYVLAPLAWIGYADTHPRFDAAPRITHTGDDHPGDPLNVALVGTEDDLKLSLLAAGWYPADPITLRSSLKIAEGTILRRRYDDAPVSNLFLFGRKQDLAFEKPVGNDPRRRHHVRFWRAPPETKATQPLWLGSVTFDNRVGLSHTTGQITHHIDADVDAERDGLMADLERAGRLKEIESVAGYHQTLSGKNGGGDPWRTDGALLWGRLLPEVAP